MDDPIASAPAFPMRRCPFAPPPEYAEIRQNEGLSKVTMPDGSWAWIATRYDDVRAILGDPRFYGAVDAGLSVHRTGARGAAEE